MLLEGVSEVYIHSLRLVHEKDELYGGNLEEVDLVPEVNSSSL